MLEAPKPELHAVVAVQRMNVRVTNNDLFDYNDCTVRAGKYRTVVKLLPAGKSQIILWSKFSVPVLAPDPANAAIDRLDPITIDCSEGRWKMGHH